MKNIKKKSNTVLKLKEKAHYEHRPVRDFKAQISKDGKFWIFKDITTHMVPRNYISKIESQFTIEQSKPADNFSSGADQAVE